MMPIETLTAFFTTSVLLALAPGPDNLFVLTQSALHGKLAGMIRNWLVHSDKAQIIMNRVAGMVFIILALKLAITER